jgi:hypothetical protein
MRVSAGLLPPVLAPRASWRFLIFRPGDAARACLAELSATLGEAYRPRQAAMAWPRRSSTTAWPTSSHWSSRAALQGDLGSTACRC